MWMITTYKKWIIFIQQTLLEVTNKLRICMRQKIGWLLVCRILFVHHFVARIAGVKRIRNRRGNDLNELGCELSTLLRCFPLHPQKKEIVRTSLNGTTLVTVIPHETVWLRVETIRNYRRNVRSMNLSVYNFNLHLWNIWLRNRRRKVGSTSNNSREASAGHSMFTSVSWCCSFSYFKLNKY